MKSKTGSLGGDDPNKAIPAVSVLSFGFLVTSVSKNWVEMISSERVDGGGLGGLWVSLGGVGNWRICSCYCS